MADTSTIVIVGAGLTAAFAAQGLREEGFEGRILLIGAEPERPYERPPLSKGYLLGTSPRDEVFVHPAQWYDENRVELVLRAEVVAIDRESGEVVLKGGVRHAYDRLLLATGSEPRRLSVPGATDYGVMYLRRLEDSDRIKAAFTRGPRVVIVGAGWIGLETAAAARAAGLEVTVLEAAELPLLRVLGPEMARMFADLHREHGVDLRFGVQVAGITGTGADGGGAVTGVELGDGTVIPADLVLVGVGITPSVALAVEAGLDVDDGVLVDDHLRTSDPAIFAAGDVANAFHPRLGTHIRVEHWENARRQGALAARTMLGQDAVFDRLPYFFSDQYDLGMEYVGYAEPGAYDHLVIRGDLDKRELVAFWLAEGRVLAGMNVNVWDVVGEVEALILSARVVDVERLANPGIALADV
ncbi:NAD(P)/FAD-dependent oxidoreductase [Cellulomonas fimi]|uniref:FAD-dependent oxidoreductase n=1 Tax=Cellulomonas fimi TaxID=1708 RepID=A0A7Y0LZH5_CELFI|nr:FAD-dependent oxidoreductase [Cellulomonas fimi]NMR20278.1 FAD-dependent oxidoreductase [Cellulomonas fimi]